MRGIPRWPHSWDLILDAEPALWRELREHVWQGHLPGQRILEGDNRASKGAQPDLGDEGRTGLSRLSLNMQAPLSLTLAPPPQGSGFCRNQYLPHA